MPDFRETHVPRSIASPRDWTLYLSRETPTRLVVFVHGFGGHPVESWNFFYRPPPDDPWWITTDLLFAGYDSKRRTITGVANEFRREIEHFYPRIRHDLAELQGVTLRPTERDCYEQLVIVGHSLGGVIVRHAIADSVERAAGSTAQVLLVNSTVRMFSPATAGFQAAGFLGMLRATIAWRAAELYLRRSSAYSDLQPGSPYLSALQRRTERLAGRSGAVRALKPSILWADPEEVVVCARYDTDPPDDSEPGTTHKSVCKPTIAYQTLGDLCGPEPGDSRVQRYRAFQTACV
jgi:pimeloyl-ACP methyl ester carboxylesterase